MLARSHSRGPHHSTTSACHALPTLPEQNRCQPLRPHWPRMMCQTSPGSAGSGGASIAASAPARRSIRAAISSITCTTNRKTGRNVKFSDGDHPRWYPAAICRVRRIVSGHSAGDPLQRAPSGLIATPTKSSHAVSGCRLMRPAANRDRIARWQRQARATSTGHAASRSRCARGGLLGLKPQIGHSIGLQAPISIR